MYKTTVYGRLTGDPEAKASQSGTQYVVFSIAVNTGKNPDGSQKSTFIRISAFNKNAETVLNYCKKGHRVVVEINNLEASAYTDQSGQAKASLNGTLSNITLVETKTEAQGQSAAPSGYGQPPQQPAQPPQYVQPPQYNRPPAQYPQPPQYGQPPAQYPQQTTLPAQPQQYPAQQPPAPPQAVGATPW